MLFFILSLTDISCPKMAQTNPNGMSQCGPDHGVCNRNLHFDSLYCHSTHNGGECGATDHYRNHVPGNEYDWGYCPGNFYIMEICIAKRKISIRCINLRLYQIDEC